MSTHIHSHSTETRKPNQTKAAPSHEKLRQCILSQIASVDIKEFNALGLAPTETVLPHEVVLGVASDVAQRIYALCTARKDDVQRHIMELKKLSQEHINAHAVDAVSPEECQEFLESYSRMQDQLIDAKKLVEAWTKLLFTTLDLELPEARKHVDIRIRSGYQVVGSTDRERPNADCGDAIDFLRKHSSLFEEASALCVA